MRPTVAPILQRKYVPLQTIAAVLGRYIFAPGEAITTLEAGGGGYGDPTRRDPALIAADVAAGLVSSQSALRDYGWQPDEEEPEAD